LRRLPPYPTAPCRRDFAGSTCSTPSAETFDHDALARRRQGARRPAAGDGGNLRFARGNATTDGAISKLSVRVESHFGKRAGAAQVSGLDADALADAVAHSEEIARLAPETPELMPPLGPQAYDPGAGHDPATAAVRVDRLA